MDAGSIQCAAQEYYSTVFESPPPEHMYRYAMVAEALKEDQSGDERKQRQHRVVPASAPVTNAWGNLWLRRGIGGDD